MEQNLLSGPHTHWQRQAGDIAPTAVEPSRPGLFPSTRVYSTGRYSASFVPCSLPRDVVAGLLPSELAIYEKGDSPLDFGGQSPFSRGPGHPVLFVFGTQEHVCPIFQRMEGLTYLEFLIAVPYVRWRNRALTYRGPLVFLPRLYLDRWLPVLLGWMCGFAKERARFPKGVRTSKGDRPSEFKGLVPLTDPDRFAFGEEYRFSSLFTNRPLIRGLFKPSGRVGNPRDFPRFEAVREIFELPLATKTPFGCMCLDFHWELEKAQMQAIEAQVYIEEPFLPGLPIGPFQSGGIDESSPGAFHLNVPWTLSRPFLPSSLGRRQEPSARVSSVPRPHFNPTHR